MHDVRKCPSCGGKTHVTDSSRKKTEMTRRRECLKCGFVFHTHELSDVELEIGAQTSIDWLTEEIRQIDISLGGILKVNLRNHLERKRNIYTLCIEALKEGE